MSATNLGSGLRPWLLGACACLVALWIGPAAAAGPSFSCAKAVAPVDRAICGDPALSALDLSLETAFREALKRDPANKSRLLEEQRRWLAQRAPACHVPATGPASVDNQRCLKTQFETRIAALGPAAAHEPDPLCARLVERVKADGGYVGREDWDVLVRGLTADPKSPVRIDFDGEDLTPKLQAMLPKSNDDEPSIGTAALHRFGPGKSLLATDTTQGTLQCHSMTFYKRDGGKIKTVDGPELDEDGDYCWTSQIFVGETAEPPSRGLFANESYAIDHSDLAVWVRDGEAWHGACRLTARYDTAFEVRDRFCATGAHCTEFDTLALALAVARSKATGDTPPEALGDATLTKLDHPPMEGDDELPTFGKTIVEGYSAFEPSTPYYKTAGPKGPLLVRISHGTLGWRSDDDYLVAVFAASGSSWTAVAGLRVHDRRTTLRDVVEKPPVSPAARAK